MMTTRRSKVIAATLVVVAVLTVSVVVDTIMRSRQRLTLANLRLSDPGMFENLEQYDQGASEYGVTDTPFMMEPLPPPPMIPARDMVLAEDEKRVIAIEVGGEHFAYPLAKLYGIGEHIVNNLFHGTPITVVYCSQTDCVRVLTAENTREPLPVMQNGLSNGELALRFHDLSYQLSKDTIPLDRYPFQIVDWSSWLKDHPDGMVFPGIDWDKVMADTPDPRTGGGAEGPR